MVRSARSSVTAERCLGIVSGVTMVFRSVADHLCQSLTCWVAGKVNLIGNIIEQEFTASSNWNLGAGLSLGNDGLYRDQHGAALKNLTENGEGNVI